MNLLKAKGGQYFFLRGVKEGHILGNSEEGKTNCESND